MLNKYIFEEELALKLKDNFPKCVMYYIHFKIQYLNFQVGNINLSNLLFDSLRSYHWARDTTGGSTEWENCETLAAICTKAKIHCSF